MSDGKDPGRSFGLIGGGALVLLGAWFLARSAGLLPDRVFEVLGRMTLPAALIVAGVALVVVSQRGGFKFRGPLPGTRLYKSRSDKWIDGVLGGLGSYLGVDPVLLRLAVIALVLVGWGSLIVGYIIMAIVVPREPLPAGPPPQA